MTRDELIQRIYSFLETYADVNPNWVEGNDIETKYSSADAYFFVAAAHQLQHNQLPPTCCSHWDNGGFHPHASVEGKAEHDILLMNIKQYSYGRHSDSN